MTDERNEDPKSTSLNDGKPEGESADTPGQEASQQNQKPPKELKLAANMYTVAYCAFMKKNKEKFRLKANDQIDIYYRALFMFMIQMTFIFTILFFEKFDITYKNSTPINLCLFFTVLILHWQCLPEARSGIYMMKYALCYPDEFTHPVTVFFLGLVQMSAVWLCEVCNLLKSMDQKKPENVIVRFVGFGLILSVPKLLIGSMENFEIQKSVGKLSLQRSRKQMAQEATTKALLPFSWLLNLIYCIYKWFFISLYYYFFPFVVIFAPILKLTYFARLIN